MGFWNRLISGEKALSFDTYDAAQRVLADPYEPFVSTGGIPVMDPGTPLAYWLNGTADAEHMWRTQPSVRKVIGFAARNVASIPLHVHERVSDTERHRITGHPLADLMASPRPRMGSYRFWEAVISDGLLYDRWAVLKRIDKKTGALRLSRVPSWRLRFLTDTLGEDERAFFWNDKEWIDFDLDDLIFDYGYAPKAAGLSPVETLRDLLDESAEAVEYRRQVWANGARAPQFLTRPAGAKPLTSDQRTRLEAAMQAYKKDGGKAGGVPLLEDGMTLESGTRMQSKDMLDLEGRKLSEVVVASAWHIAPELIGAREGNYSNVDAYRQMLYRDSLGPYIVAWEQAINVGLTPDLADGRPLYVEANIEAKLRGSFQEQAEVMSTATGAPWLTRNEARSLQNRPPIDGGNELVVPLNVLTGGQASPRDSGSQNEGPKAREGVQVKARAPQTHEDKHAQVLAAFFKRQHTVVATRIGAGSQWWDAARWDKELAEDLWKLAIQTSETVAKSVLDEIGFSPDEYDVARTLAFLAAVAERQAKGINIVTEQQVSATLADAEPDVSHVFDIAQESRSKQIATTLVTATSGFAAREAASQLMGDKGTKTWRAGSNPRSSHARMNGETVPVGEKFSNGADYPGDGSLSTDETAGCNCSLVINPPDARERESA